MDLPNLGVEQIDRRAEATARTLADSFFRQDRAEKLLVTGSVSEAAAVRTDAQNAMGDVFVEEFPHLDASRATHAGREFMTALFMQDELENQESILDHEDDLSDCLLLEALDRRPSAIHEDPRWMDVRNQLLKVCELADIDPSYADYQTRFWRYHGSKQQRGEYERAASEAQIVKLRAMIQREHPDTFRKLGQYFVAGVRLHDQWDKRDRDSNFEKLVALVEKYYAKVFALQGGVPS